MPRLRPKKSPQVIPEPADFVEAIDTIRFGDTWHFYGKGQRVPITDPFVAEHPEWFQVPARRLILKEATSNGK
jgi:hypothetical protein